MTTLDGLWEISDRVVCTHPGWRTLHGWPAVRTSYARIFENQALQFIVTSVDVHVDGDVAWVTCDENIWGAGGTGTVAALNLFSRSPVGDGWKLVAHHASPVAPTQDEHPEDQEDH